MAEKKVEHIEDDYKMQRTAMRMVQKYGLLALPKTVTMIQYCMFEANDNDTAKRWIKIGKQIKDIQKQERLAKRNASNKN